MKRLLVFGILCWQIALSFSQVPLFSSHQPSYPNQGVRPLLQYETTDGFIWFGTDKGVLQFDGIRFQAYNRPDTAEVEVTAFYEDRAHNLWVGYADGAIFIRKPYGLLQAWMPEEGLPVVRITGFSEDAQGNFWIATYGEGLYYHNGKHLYNLDETDGLPANDVYDIVCGREGAIWVGTDGGLSKIFADAEDKRVTTFSTEHGLPDMIVHKILPDQANGLWLGLHDGGACRFSTATLQTEIQIDNWEYGAITSMLLYEGVELWLGTETQGLWRVKLTTLEPTPIYNDGLQMNSKIYDVHKDAEGNSWVLSNSGGIMSANRRIETLPIGQGIKDIQTVLHDHSGKLWLGTASGLYQVNSSGDAELVLNIANVLSLHERVPGEVWVGTFDSGLWLLNTNSGKSRHITGSKELEEAGILSITGSDTTLWIASIGGVLRIQLNGNPFVQNPVIQTQFMADQLPNFLYKIMVDSQGRVWFASDGDGMSMLETNGEVKKYPSTAEGNPLGTVYAMAEDHTGTLWVSTAKQGVFYLDEQRGFMPIQTVFDAAEKPYTAMTASLSGEILLFRKDGIDLLNPTLKHLLYFQLPMDEPGTNAVSMDANGQLWVGVGAQVLVYTDLKESFSIHPSINLTEIALDFESIDLHKKTSFSNKENNLAFKYVGLWYTHPEAVQYRYRLDGFDADWIYSRDRTATYSKLPAGTYTFKVQATENGQFVDEPEAKYSFTIQRAWWQTPLFWGAALAVVAAFVWLLIKNRERKAQHKADVERENVERQFELLRSQINPHFLFNSFNTLAALIEESPPQAVGYVEKLSDFFRVMLTYREEQLIPLKEELRLVSLYCSLLQYRFHDRLLVSIQPEENTTVSIVPFTLQLLVENAVKHNIVSANRPLSIRISFDEVYIHVENTLQEKPRAQESTGFGLQSIKKHYRILGTKPVLIVRTPTHFTVSVPKIHETKIV